MQNPPGYDALMILSFGGPEGLEDVMPFLENVLRGKNVPEERKREVAHHYEVFGGVSPINRQLREFKDALEAELRAHGITLPLHWGNRNWHPMLADTVREMTAAGARRVLVFVTSGFSCYSGCRQYLEDLEKARAEVPGAPVMDKIRVFFNHPLFIEVTARNWQAARDNLPAELRDDAVTLFTAHSLPVAMAEKSDYTSQLMEAARLTAEKAGIRNWRLVYQSRSGPPSQPWLEPDVGVALREIRAAGAKAAILLPIGFVSDHMEVLYDLDHEARELCGELGLALARGATPGTHPLFVAMARELIQERLDPSIPRRTLGAHGPRPDTCPAGCCPSGRPAAGGPPRGAPGGSEKA